MTLKYVEDYLEFLYGTMDKDGNPISVSSYAISRQNQIKLATYDKSPISNMGAFCSKARISQLESCLTDKQIDLARKIIEKYRKQFLHHGIVVPSSDQVIDLRHAVRQIDRSKKLDYNVDKKKVYLRFPYSPQKISVLHEYTSSSAGSVSWSNTDKIWSFDLTEGNIKKILELFSEEDLKIDENLTPIVTDVLTASPTTLPSLSIKNNRFVLSNCHTRVNEYLESKNFKSDDLENTAYWASQAVNLGLRLDESLDDFLTDNEQVNTIIKNKTVVLPSKNQPNGEWYNSLLVANHLLSKQPWVLFLNWWTKETNWGAFSNTIEYKDAKDKGSFSSIPKSFIEMLLNLEDPIVVVDSVIGRETLKGFIEQNSLKMIYISDIGNAS